MATSTNRLRAAVLATTILATPAAAAERHTGWYGTLSAGLNSQRYIEVEDAGLDRLSFRDGPVVHGGVGYAFESGVRLELEGGYSQNAARSFRLHEGGSARNIGGEVSTYRIMANLAYDFGADKGWIVHPYVEAGIGGMAAQVDIGHPDSLSGQRLALWHRNGHGTTSLVPAFQVGVGMSMPLEHVTPFVSVRYFRVITTPEVNNGTHARPAGSDWEIASTELIVGIRF